MASGLFQTSSIGYLTLPTNKSRKNEEFYKNVNFERLSGRPG